MGTPCAYIPFLGNGDIMVTGYQYTCSEDAFRIRSEDRDEVVESVQEHARDKHDMDLSRDEIVDGMEEQDVST